MLNAGGFQQKADSKIHLSSSFLYHRILSLLYDEAQSVLSGGAQSCSPRLQIFTWKDWEWEHQCSLDYKLKCHLHGGASENVRW